MRSGGCSTSTLAARGRWCSPTPSRQRRPASVSSAGSSAPAHLPPRFIAPSRLQLRFLDATTTPPRPGSTSPRRRRPATRSPDGCSPTMPTTPWSSSTPRGRRSASCSTAGSRCAVTWEGRARTPGPARRGTCRRPRRDRAPRQPRRRRRPARRHRAGRGARRRREPARRAAASRRHHAVVERSAGRDRHGAGQRAGRPAHRRRPGPPRLELYDDSDDYALSPARVAARRAPRSPLATERGMWSASVPSAATTTASSASTSTTTTRCFHPVHAAIRELARHGGPQDGFLADVQAAADVRARPGGRADPRAVRPG